jgi:hypothetical protein
MLALCYSPFAIAQTTVKEPTGENDAAILSESAFTFTEAQLGEDDNSSQNVTIVGSNSNAYASEVGYRFSPVRFRYRAFNQKYNQIYVNGNPLNDAESGQFRYSLVGGLNNQTRTVESSLPFEDNNFAMSAMGGSNNYNFRPSQFATGHRLSLAGANRNYTFRGMYTYNSGLNDAGWAWSASLTYRWANMETAQVEGTFYNALSYFFGIEKVIGDGTHSVSLVTWGNPTERATQGASTDEMYWLANNNNYNPYWGYQDGKKRNSRIVKDFAPSALLTWDWKLNESDKITTSLFGKYAMYSSSKLNYNNSTNPQPDYYSNMPSYYFNVWDPNDEGNTQEAVESWRTSYYRLRTEANRQLNWNALYYANKAANAQGGEAMYYQQAYHNDMITFSLASILKKQLTNKSTLTAGFNVATNKALHYQTMEDLLGANSFHNTNYYLVGTNSMSSDAVQYDMNNPNALIKEGDRFGYDYNIFVNKANLWATYMENFGPLHYHVSARLGGVAMQREGKMRNGLAPENSFGKSGTAKFIDGGVKTGGSVNLGRGNTIIYGLGYEKKAPEAKMAFVAPEINNDFVDNLKNEDVYSFELGYQLQSSWLKANLNGFYSYLQNVTEYSMFYYDSENSFSYVSMSGINKKYFGLELGLNFKVSSSFNIKALGTISDAYYTNNAKVRYMLSNNGKYQDDVVVSKDMRESGTPLTAGSIDLSYHGGGWFLDLIGNYYDRIYLSYTPVTRYMSQFPMSLSGDGSRDLSTCPEQATGRGGFMLDASIGRSIYLSKGSLSINLMITNLLNNTRICTGGFEQSRRDVDATGEKIRTYSFLNNPKKFYANGINGMLIISYKF